MRTHVGLTLALGLLLAASCSNKLTGEIRVESAEHGSWTIEPESCNSGEHNHFHGVDLFGGEHKMRAVSDPTHGFNLVIPLPGGGDQALVVDSKNCTTFVVNVERQSSSINDITNVKGHIQVDCTDDTGTVKGEVKFENCH